MQFNTKERNVFVCSDPHYSHKNLIKSLSTWKSGAHRDFKSVNHHNDTLVNNINKTVGKDDVLFLLGDVAFGGLITTKYWQGVTGLGFSASINLNVASQNIDFRWASVDYVMENGGVL